jgi:predicted ATPase
VANIQDLGGIEDEFAREFPEGSTARNLAVGSVRSQKMELVERYGANPDARSHGELFLKLLASRLVPGGLYLLDEPEAPLSPRSILELIALIRDRVAQGCQFVIATHSSMLLALPEATILEFTSEGIRERAYDDLEQVALEKSFLQAPDRFLRHL